MSRTSLPRRIASRVESTMMPAITGARPFAASTVAATGSRYSSWSSVSPSPVEPPAAMPRLPAPISQSTCDATSLKSISPSFRNGVVIGGITPVGRAFMGLPSHFDSLVTGVSPLFPAEPTEGRGSDPVVELTRQGIGNAARTPLAGTPLHSAARCYTGSDQRLTTQRGRNVIPLGALQRVNRSAGEMPAVPAPTTATAIPRRPAMGRIDMIESLIVWLIIGAIAGWLAGQIVKGYGLGLVGNIVVGIIGAIIAGWLLPMIGFVLVGGILAAIVNAVIGAVILLIIVGFFKK